MTCDCNDSTELRAQVKAFMAQVAGLEDKVKNLEDKNDSINDDCNEA